MEGVKEKQGQLVFGLDIGTRSIVGTVGYLNGGKFHVLAQRSKEHETRAMLDGQIKQGCKVEVGASADALTFSVRAARKKSPAKSPEKAAAKPRKKAGATV